VAVPSPTLSTCRPLCADRQQTPQVSETCGVWGRLEGDEAEAGGLDDGFGAALGVEFAEDGVDVEFDGMVADVEAKGDGFVRQSFSEQVEYV
jgi:hypothetical protein